MGSQISGNDFSPSDDLSVLMARSRNSFQSGYQYSLENFDKSQMKTDPVWRETQSRIEFLKMRNITMSSSADRNSLARRRFENWEILKFGNPESKHKQTLKLKHQEIV